MSLQIWLLSLCVVTAAAFVFLRVKHGGEAGLISKMVASFSFVLLGLFSLLTINNTLAGVLVVGGLICGLMGDALLDLKVMKKQNYGAYLNSGMASFFAGHIFYIAAMLIVAGALISVSVALICAAVAIVVTAAIFLISSKINIKFGKFYVQSLSYSLLLVFACAVSIYVSFININFIVLSVGMLLFLVSDLILSMQFFGGKQDNTMLTIVNHVTYYAAQICVASFLFLI